MASTKAQLEDIIGIYKSQIATLEGIVSDLRADRETQTTQIMNLQEALIAIRSPDAYRDQRMDKLDEPDQISAADKNKAKQVMQIQQQYVQSIEGDTFESADDLQDLLGGIIMGEGTKPPPSIHGNSES